MPATMYSIAAEQIMNTNLVTLLKSIIFLNRFHLTWPCLRATTCSKTSLVFGNNRLRRRFKSKEQKTKENLQMLRTLPHLPAENSSQHLLIYSKCSIRPCGSYRAATSFLPLPNFSNVGSSITCTPGIRSLA